MLTHETPFLSYTSPVALEFEATCQVFNIKSTSVKFYHFSFTRLPESMIVCTISHNYITVESIKLHYSTGPQLKMRLYTIPT